MKTVAELSVHIPCGGIRGPLQRPNRDHPELPIRRQSCRCEDDPQRWPGCDVSREKDLCVICFRATAGGTYRWSWLACEDCRAVNDAIGSCTGTTLFALGRHSIMNGVAVRGGQSPAVTAEQIPRLVRFARGDQRLTDWRDSEYRRLASAFDPRAGVPLSEWQTRWPPGAAASLDAFRRLMGAE